MFFAQLVRLVGSLLEFLIVLLLLLVILFGVGLLSLGHTVAGIVIAGGASWFIAGAVGSKR